MAAIFAIALVVGGFFLRLFLVKAAWAIVIVPIFHLPQLTWLQAWAAAFLLSLVHSTLTFSKKE